jgi:hypothetical protein
VSRGQRGGSPAVVNLSSLDTVTKILRRLLVAAKVVPSSLILVTLMMEATCSSETSVLIIATQRNISEDGIFRY